MEIERLKVRELHFIAIVADEIDFMPQLPILSDETSAPILIATSKPDANEREEALNNGANYYGEIL
jgi:AmiR/NasT family two-component response regulator